MNLKTGVRVLNVDTGLIGNIRSVEGEGETARVCVAPQDGGEDIVCAADSLKTLKGRPRKMA